MATILIPTIFLRDHRDRGLPTPVCSRDTKNGCIIRADDPALPELISDARYYAEGGTDADRWIVSAARALLNALARKGVQIGE